MEYNWIVGVQGPYLETGGRKQDAVMGRVVNKSGFPTCSIGHSVVESRAFTWRGGGKWAIRMDGVNVLYLESLPEYKAWRTGYGLLVPFQHKYFTL